MEITVAERITQSCRYASEVKRECLQLYSACGKSIEFDDQEGSTTYIFKDNSKIRLIEESYRGFY